MAPLPGELDAKRPERFITQPVYHNSPDNCKTSLTFPTFDSISCTKML